jgi:hypothetical protein
VQPHIKEIIGQWPKAIIRTQEFQFDLAVRDTRDPDSPSIAAS